MKPTPLASEYYRRLTARGERPYRNANCELLERGHAVTIVSRSGTVGDVDDPDFVAVSSDATEADDIAKLATGHDAVASALGPSDNDSPEILTEMMEATIEGLRRASVDRRV